MYTIDIVPSLVRTLKKLKRKNPNQLRAINKKIKEIVENPYHYKPLQGSMHGTRRVHIDSSFVLLFEIDEAEKVVVLLDFDHHDNIY